MKRYLPNILTGVRLLSPLLLWSASRQPLLLPYIFFFAALTDLFDGALARHWHCQTVAGKILDPLADKLLIITSLSMLTAWHKVSLALFLAVVARDALILLGACLLWAKGEKIFPPSWLSKVNTAVQIALCFLGFLALSYPLESLSLLCTYVEYVLWITVITSGGLYIVKGAHVLWGRS